MLVRLYIIQLHILITAVRRMLFDILLVQPLFCVHRIRCNRANGFPKIMVLFLQNKTVPFDSEIFNHGTGSIARAFHAKKTGRLSISSRINLG